MQACRATSIAAGFYNSFVITSAGSVFSFGLDNYSQATAKPKADGIDKEAVGFPSWCLIALGEHFGPRGLDACCGHAGWMGRVSWSSSTGGVMEKILKPASAW